MISELFSRAVVLGVVPKGLWDFKKYKECIGPDPGYSDVGEGRHLHIDLKFFG